MSSTSVQLLLRQLGSGINHIGNGTRASGDANVNFNSVMKAARAGELRSGIAVKPSPRLPLELSSDRINALSEIADIAQAHGLKRVLVNDDPHEYVLDVELREVFPIEGTVQAGIATGIDSYIRFTQADHETTSIDRVGDQLLRNLVK